MKKTVIYTLVLSLALMGCTGNTDEDNSTQEDTQASQSSSTNYQLSKTYEIDINQDDVPDQIQVLEKKCTPNGDTANTQPSCRRLQIALSYQTDSTIYGYNDNIIECSDCGGAGVGDPFQDIKTKDNLFSVESLFGACDKTFEVITFRYDTSTNKIMLYKIGQENYSCEEQMDGDVLSSTVEQTTQNFGQVEFTAFDRSIIK